MLPFLKLNSCVTWLRICSWKCTRKALIMCLYGSLTPLHRVWRPSTMAYHSDLASLLLPPGRRYASSRFTARA